MDKEDRRRIKQLLTDAVLVLCKASLRYRRKFTVEGLIGITLDSDEVHLVNINELVQKDEDEIRTNGRDSHKRSSSIHHGSAISRQGEPPERRLSHQGEASERRLSHQAEAPERRLSHQSEASERRLSHQGEPVRVAEKRPSTTENEVLEKRRRHDDLPVDLAKVKSEAQLVNHRTMDGAVDLSGGDKSINNNDKPVQASTPVISPGGSSSLLQPRFPQQMVTPRGPPLASFNNYSQFSLTPGMTSMRGRPRLSAAINSPMDTVCMVCNFRCNTKTELYNHANTMKCKICPCPHCPKAFCDPGKLNQHITVRHEEPKFSCLICGHRYSTKQNMQIHIRRHHGDQLDMSKFAIPMSPGITPQEMQLIIQQSVRFHNPNSPHPGSHLDYPFTPSGDDSQEMTSQSDDDDSQPPLSPVNIAPQSYPSMPLFPDQQAPVPITEAARFQASQTSFPNLTQAIQNHNNDNDMKNGDSNTENGINYSETPEDLRSNQQLNPQQPNNDEIAEQPINMCNQNDQRVNQQNTAQDVGQPCSNLQNQAINQEVTPNINQDMTPQNINEENMNQTSFTDDPYDRDIIDNPPELTLSSELTL